MVESILPYFSSVDLVLVMTVEPGFGGQKFIEPVTEKIKTIRQRIDTEGYSIHLEVDGGINKKTAGLAFDAGVNIIVAGSSIFQSLDGIDGAIRKLKKLFF